MLYQQITGQPSVLYYAAKIFKDAGFASDADATRVSVVLGFFKLIMTGEAVPHCTDLDGLHYIKVTIKKYNIHIHYI